jgi:hypothetical protein
MKSRVTLSLLICYLLCTNPVDAGDSKLGDADLREPIVTGLSTPSSIQDAFFEWENAPGWVFKDVVFGVKQGSLVFAKFTAIPPDGKPRYQDRSAEADYLLDDSKSLPELVAIDIGNGKQFFVRGFTVGILANGRAVIDSARGIDSTGKEVELTNLAAGSCGAPRVIGACSDFCVGNCVGNVASGDPCVCSGTGGCTTGSARWVCNVGTCTTACAFQAGIGCVCL